MSKSCLYPLTILTTLYSISLIKNRLVTLVEPQNPPTSFQLLINSLNLSGEMCVVSRQQAVNGVTMYFFSPV